MISKQAVGRLECEVHGPNQPATNYRLPDGQYRVRCKVCHRENEKARRHADMEGYRHYIRTYRKGVKKA